MLIESTRHFLAEHGDKIPFFMSAANGGMRATKISMQRIIEAAVTAVILAGIGYIMIIPRLEERINQQAMMTANQIIELKAAIASNEIQRQADYRYLAAQITRSDVKR